MPSQTGSGKEGLVLGGDSRQRNTKLQHKSKTTKEKCLSPRAHQKGKLKEKVKEEIRIRPPHADVPFEFVRDGDRGTVVRTKHHGNQKQQLWKGANKEDEIIKYMSDLPAFLQRGEKPQDNILSFGVLDWDRLEKWKHEQKGSSKVDKTRTALNGSSSSMSRAGSSTATSTVRSEALHFNRGKSRTSPGHRRDAGSKGVSKEDKSCAEDNLKKLAGGKELDSDKQKSICSGALSQFSSEGSLPSKDKASTTDGEFKSTVESFEEWASDSADQHCPENQERIVLLLPKDFSRSGCIGMPRRTSVDGKSARFNWNSFSDVFSVAEVNAGESYSDVPFSSPLLYPVDTEADLDMKLDKLINSQNIDLSLNLSAFSWSKEECNDVQLNQTTSEGLDHLTACKTSEISDQNIDRMKTEKPVRRYSLDMGWMNRSFSFRETSAVPPLRSSYLGVKSGPAGPEISTSSAYLHSKAADARGKARISPLRKLLDPFLKPKVAKLFNSSENTQQCIKQLNEFNLDARSVYDCRGSIRGAATVKAFLQVTIKNGLPLFKFVVDTNSEVLASTVRKLSVIEKDDPGWLYTFYSVQKSSRKSSRWKNQGNKGKSSEFTYNVVGQMKVVKSQLPDKVSESVLCSVDPGIGAEEAAAKFVGKDELAAIVIKRANQQHTHDGGKSHRDSDLKSGDVCCCEDPDQNGISGNVVVILPGGTHSLPNEGGPSPLIKRWRSGGSCDCGGWDIGCKLQVLTSRGPLPARLDLFLKGGRKQERPAFSLVPYRNGIVSVEFDAAVSKLQAFGVCIAVINNLRDAHLLDVNDDREVGKQDLEGVGPARYATFPPLSPVGRV